MRSTAGRLGVLAAVIVAAAVLFVVLDNGSDEDGGPGTGTTTTTAGPEVVTVRNGNPVAGVKTLTYDKGDLVNLEVRLNRPEEEIHVHGYEIEKPA